MAAPNWSCLLKEFVEDEKNDTVLEISKGIADGLIKLLDVVEALGPSLTSQQPHLRARSVTLLSKLLSKLPTPFLTGKEAAVLVTFLCDRLKDHHSVTPHVLHCMLALSRLAVVGDEDVERMLREVFREVTIQTLAQGDRRHWYQMLQHLLHHRLTVLQKMEGDFVFGFIQSMDGEKDPRNLLVVFECASVIAHNIPLGVFVEELFEVVSCYFPIDFTPPPNDAFEVSKEDLVMGLRRCLASSAQFAKFGLPLLLEKVTSNLQSAKIDSLQTLAACAEVYGAESLKDYVGAFWSNIRREVFSASNETVEKCSLEALCAIVTALSLEVSQGGKSSELSNFLDEVFKDCQRYLCDPDQKLIYPSSRLLQAAAVASSPACTAVLDRVVPLLLQQFDTFQQTAHRKVILGVMLSFLKTLSPEVHHHSHPGCPLTPHKESLYPVLVSTLLDGSAALRNLATQAVIALLDMPDLLSPDDVHQVAEHCRNLLLTDSDSTVRKQAAQGLSHMARIHPQVVTEVVLPSLGSHLETEPMEVAESAHTTAQQNGGVSRSFLLETLAQLSVCLPVVRTSVPLFIEQLTRLDKGAQQQKQDHDVVAEAECVCRCLCSVVELNVADADADVREYLQSNVALPCIRLCMEAGEQSRENPRLLTDPQLLQLLAKVVRIIVQCSEEKFTSQLLERVVPLFLGAAQPAESLCINVANFTPLQVGSPWSHTQLIIVLGAVLCAAPKTATIPGREQLQSGLLAVSLDCAHAVSSEAAAKCTAGLLNKLPPGAELDSTVEHYSSVVQARLSDSSLRPESRQRAVAQWAWLTKALLLRGHAQQRSFVDKLLDLLEDSALAPAAAAGIHTVLHQFEDVMSAEMHAEVTLMYRQRFFIFTRERLIKGFHGAHHGQKQYYLGALSHILRFMPKEVLIPELSSLLPLLVQSLQCEDEALWLTTLTTLQEFLGDSPDVLTSHADELIPAMVKLAKFKPKMRVRISALRCLSNMTSLPSHVALRHQKDVVHGLSTVLDDHKRLVRKEAASARAHWYLLGTPGM